MLLWAVADCGSQHTINLHKSWLLIKRPIDAVFDAQSRHVLVAGTFCVCNVLGFIGAAEIFFIFVI